MKARKIDRWFYALLFLSVAIAVLPPRYKMGVYTPNILGWAWVWVCLPATGLTLVIASIQDLKLKDWQGMMVRLLIFAVVFIIGAILWKAKPLGNW